MNPTDRSLLRVLFLLLAPACTSGGGDGDTATSSSTAEGSASESSTSTTVAIATTASTGSGGGGGAGAVGPAAGPVAPSVGVGGAGGAPLPTGQECFSQEDEESCADLGCNYWGKPYIWEIVGEECVLHRDDWYCLIWDPDMGSDLWTTNYVRDFASAGPLVLGLGEGVYDGWTACKDVEERPLECCCLPNSWPECDGIMHWEPK
jgi:hypothetical protein